MLIVWHWIGRPPLGGRGLKSDDGRHSRLRRRRPPLGGRGLKSDLPAAVITVASRPPLGGRGLKFARLLPLFHVFQSPSPRRAWIEMLN